MSIYKKGKDWYIDYRVHGRRKREKVGPSQKLAIAENNFLNIKIMEMPHK